MFSWAIAATLTGAMGLMLHPFGSVGSLLKEKTVWRGFEAQGPVLLVARAERWPLVGTGTHCSKWGTALEGIGQDALLMVHGKGASLAVDKASWTAWAPWSSEDKAILEGCKEVPCLIKLDPSEIAEMRALPKLIEVRQGKLFELVQRRVARYLETSERRGYEMPGQPVDPWDWIEKKGFTTPGARREASPRKDNLRVRKLDWAPGQLKPLRQVLDERVTIAAQAGSQSVRAARWMRDLYTSHYFDSWGEWAYLDCDAERGEAVLVQALVVELDLLKKNNVLARMGRPKMRKAIEEQGAAYLDKQADRARRLAE